MPMAFVDTGFHCQINNYYFFFVVSSLKINKCFFFLLLLFFLFFFFFSSFFFLYFFLLFFSVLLSFQFKTHSEIILQALSGRYVLYGHCTVFGNSSLMCSLTVLHHRHCCYQALHNCKPLHCHTWSLNAARLSRISEIRWQKC